MITSPAVLLFFFVTLLIFWRRADLRRSMIWAGTLSLPVLLIAPLTSLGFFQLLSNSQAIEFFLWRGIMSFSFGALAVVLYEVILGSHFTKTKGHNRHHLGWLAFGPVILMILFSATQISFVLALVVAILVNLIILLILRPDLLADAGFSGLSFAVLYCLLFVLTAAGIPGSINQLWFSDILSGLTVFGVPLEELVAAFLFGALWGPLYVACKDLKERVR